MTMPPTIIELYRTIEDQSRTQLQNEVDVMVQATNEKLGLPALIPHHIGSVISVAVIDCPIRGEKGLEMILDRLHHSKRLNRPITTQTQPFVMHSNIHKSDTIQTLSLRPDLVDRVYGRAIEYGARHRAGSLYASSHTPWLIKLAKLDDVSLKSDDDLDHIAGMGIAVASKVTEVKLGPVQVRWYSAMKYFKDID